jgi:hypothetical protein
MFYVALGRSTSGAAFKQVFCGIFFMSFIVLSCSNALAGEYKVYDAISAGDISDKGTATCDYKSSCKITSAKLHLSFMISNRDPVYKTSVRVEISDDVGRWDCCFFPDGAKVASRDTTDVLLRFNIYTGRRRSRASEFLVNEPFGSLYLGFLDEN